jgi:HEXXH motif-containing protein
MEMGPPLPSPTLYAFEPSAERAHFLDQRIRSQLDGSVRYLVSRIEGHFPVSPEKTSAFLQALAQGPVPPLTFAVYSDLVLAIDRHDLKEARRLFDLLLAARGAPDGLQLRDLGDRATDEDSDRYFRHTDTDDEVRLDLVPPSPGGARAAREKIQEALSLLDGEDPELAAEIRALLREIVLCGKGSSPGTLPFDGASSFMLWGAILLNADRSRDVVAMVQAVAHESAHQLLFGLCPDEPLVGNDPAERHSSPLRGEPRPLEGIYHAVFVCARMHRALRHLADSARLSSPQREEAKKAMRSRAEAFAAGMGTLQKHATLTEPGRAILDGATAYMSRFG